MGQADTLYELARQRQQDLVREAELARLAASARGTAASARRLRLAAVLALLTHLLPTAPGADAKHGSPAHA